MLRWFVDKYKEYGVDVEFVTHISQKGAQFVQGFGGIGNILRYKVNFTNLAAFGRE